MRVKKYFMEWLLADMIIREIIPGKLYQGDQAGAYEFAKNPNSYIICVANGCYIGRDAYYPVDDISFQSSSEFKLRSSFPGNRGYFLFQSSSEFKVSVGAFQDYEELGFQSSSEFK